MIAWESGQNGKVRHSNISHVDILADSIPFCRSFWSESVRFIRNPGGFPRRESSSIILASCIERIEHPSSPFVDVTIPFGVYIENNYVEPIVQLGQTSLHGCLCTD